MATMTDVRAAQPEWFSRGNKRFFGDVSYKLLHSATRKPFLVRGTFAWTDMFNQPKRLHYRVNPLSETLEIQPLIDTIFSDMEAVKDWLKTQ